MQRSLPVLALLLSGAAYGQSDPIPLRYDFVSANIAIPDTSEIGLTLEGSTSVAQDLFVFGQYLDYETRDRIELEALQIGVGRIWHIRRNVDFVGSLSYGDNQTLSRGVEDEEEGVLLSAGLRGWATPRLELSGFVTLDGSRGESTDLVHEFGVQYFRDARLSFGGKLRSDEGDTALLLGARFYFGASRRPL